MLTGAGLRDSVKLNASGKISSGFSIVRTLALGADVTSAARAFMLSLGCIQALKCNSNKCPTGITTLDKDLMFGLDPEEKTNRVYHFQRKTVKAAAGIAGIMGYEHVSDVNARDVMRRGQQSNNNNNNNLLTLADHFPPLSPGCLLEGKGPAKLQTLWDNAS
uniref:Glutamate synthase domain-containing protein n=1 Tax=Cyclophora tenuis TaxID=216820 RepID=A0A7S1D9H9_CYCTE